MSSAIFSRNTHKKYVKFARGEHIYLYSDVGKRYIDGASGTVIANIGHGRSDIAKVMAHQAETLAFAAPVVATTEPAEKLAERIAALAPPEFTKVWYQTSGSEGNEAAIKLARVVHVESGNEGKYLVVGRWQSYHGTTVASLSVTGHTPRRHPFEPMLLPYPHIVPPYCYRCPFGKTAESCTLECAHDLERVIQQTNPSVVSAFLCEPVVGSSAGVIYPRDGYYEVVREICDKYNIIWIVDEVMTGFWRTGPTFAFQHWTAEPDVIVFAKGVTAGYAPLAGMIVKQKHYDVVDGGSGTLKAAGTLAGNPVSCAVGLKVLDIMKDEKIPQRALDLGPHFHSCMEELREFDIVGDVRVKGLLGAVEFVKDKKSRQPFPAQIGLFNKVVHAAFERGLMIYGEKGIIDGTHGDIVMVAPPLVASKEEIAEIVRLLAEAVKKVQEEVTS